MSLVINTTSPEGLVIEADSRQSYRNRKGISRIGSETAKKLFQINERIGVAITGLAFFNDSGVTKNVSTVIDDFKNDNDVTQISVKEVAEKLHKEYGSRYDVDGQLKNLEQKVRKELTHKGFTDIQFKKGDLGLEFSFKEPNGKAQKRKANIEPINFLVAGFNNDKSHEVYICYLPGPIQKMRDSKQKGIEYGASWLGQTDLVNRIIRGFDPRIFNVQSINKLANEMSSQKLNKELGNLEYAIQWGTMTLQDAVDFSDLMIKTTSALQNFSDGIQAEPGEMPGVGGAVDIAVITKKQGFKWLSKKGLKYNEEKYDIE